VVRAVTLGPGASGTREVTPALVGRLPRDSRGGADLGPGRAVGPGIADRGLEPLVGVGDLGGDPGHDAEVGLHVSSFPE